MFKKEDKKNIFSEFEAASKNEWLAEVGDFANEKQMKGLVWHTPQGFSTDVYYTENELTPIAYLADFQTHGRDSLKQLKKWEYRELVAVKPGKLESANQEAVAALASGAEGVIFDLGTPDTRDFDPELLLRNIQLTENSLSFRCQGKIASVFDSLSQYLTKEKRSPACWQGTLYADPIAHWNLTGYPYENGLDELVYCTGKISDLPGINFLSVRSDHFHAAGANLVQELAFVLNTAVAYLDHFTNEGIDAGNIARKIEFSVAVGSSYFMEIAKLRALKMLFSRIIQTYGEKDFSATDVRVHAISASRSKTIREPYTNIVRNTAEAMAAILGGCHSLTLLPFDQAYENSGALGQRISRNISLLLREEAHFEKVNDPVSGSYYIAQLTDKLAEHAWQLFLKVEAMGGCIEAFKRGFIQEEVARSAKERLAHLKKGEQILIGVNKYQSGENYAELGKIKNREMTQHEKLTYPLLTPLPKE